MRRSLAFERPEANVRALLIIIILGVGGWFGGRALGWFGGTESQAPESKSGAKAPSVQAKSTPPVSPAPTPSVDEREAKAAADLARAKADAEAETKAIADGITAIADGRPVDRSRLEAIAARSADTVARDSARAEIDATSTDAWTKWIALSRLYTGGRGAPGDRAKLYAAVLEAAKGAFRAPGARESTIDYTVAAGDALAKICDRYRKDPGLALTPGELRWVNGLRGDLIRVGQTLKIPKVPTSIQVSKGSFRLRLLIGDGLVREYPVAIGRENKTPAATFTVQHMLVKAPWKDPVSGQLIHFGEPGYAIGTRWIGFEDTADASGLGIHGTNDPASIGTAASLGCIRLANENVEELFDLVPAGTKVTITDAKWPGY